MLGFLPPNLICPEPGARAILAAMISLSDRQLTVVMDAARVLPPEKRSVFLERVAAYLQIQCGRFGDHDVANAAQLALRGLLHQPAA
jgi:hypothetical protein